MNKNKILTMLIIIAAVIIIANRFSKIALDNSISLAEYASLRASTKPDMDDQNQPPIATGNQGHSPEPTASALSPDKTPLPTQTPEPTPSPSSLTGASLNGTSQLSQRTKVAEGFYYEPVSDKLRRYMTGVSYPASEELLTPEITFDELRYVHILHYGFDGNPREGELICNEYIAKDLTEIFYELYRNEYQLEKVLLIDEYEGDDNASMEDNNTSCFNYRTVPESTNLSKHAYGLAVDINPLYNPYITYSQDGGETIFPASALPYTDRSASFPYKIDSEDLCYKLFVQHGFIWGGNWNNSKDYQHFYKTISQP